MLHNLWLTQLRNLVQNGVPAGPRGLQTFEVLDQKFSISTAHRNLLDVPARQLSYRYAVAEWLWIATGHSDVASIDQYNPNIKRFSDDGIFLTGAYGPYFGQHGIRKMKRLFERDPWTRQAVLQVPRPTRVPVTKDEPCTLSLQFLFRGNRLHCIATMRSSDVWLGLPYDIFTFTMLQMSLAGEMGWPVGTFTLNAGSSHLYESDLPAAKEVLLKTYDDGDQYPRTILTPGLPGLPPDWLEEVFVHRSLDYMPDDPGIWKTYAFALCSPTQEEARRHLIDGESNVVPTRT